MKAEMFKSLEDLMTAVTFAEKNLHEDALVMMDRRTEKNRARQNNRKETRPEDLRPQMRL